MAEIRGRDAAGFWVWRDDHYVFEKRPIPAEDLIRRSPRWKSLRYHPGSLYLLHTRAATEGDPNDNVNNHPHIGKHSVMVHNGCIFNFESIVRDQNLSLGSDCDSEVLLRLAEAKESVEDGLKHMFQITHANTGTASIAVAVVDRRTPDRIFCTRNMGNPLYLVRSERFNCTFFVSTEQIFELALEMLYESKDLKVIGGTVETVSPHYLYELTADGKWSSKHLVSFYQQPSFGYGHNSEYDDDDVVLVKHYVSGIVDGVPYSIDISGNMTKLGEEEPEEDLADLEFMEDDKEGMGFVQSMEMTEEIEDDLRAYLQEKMREIEV
jgi:predicted glutamine amidotransferase